MSGALGQNDQEACPCGSGRDYAVCCRPLHRQERSALTAEELMRSRYSAYVHHEDDHLFRTWHPRTRPADVETDNALTWEGLEVLETSAGGPEDQDGVVEFRASYRLGDQRGALHERGRFTRRAGRWLYVDGDELTD